VYQYGLEFPRTTALLEAVIASYGVKFGGILFGEETADFAV
jgi:hypothetical protein